MQEKRCRTCGETKPRSEFTGRYAKCKACRAAASRRRRIDQTPDEVAADRRKRKEQYRRDCEVGAAEVSAARQQRRRLVRRLDQLEAEMAFYEAQSRDAQVMVHGREMQYCRLRLAGTRQTLAEHETIWPDLRTPREAARGVEFDPRKPAPERVTALDELVGQLCNEIMAKKKAREEADGYVPPAPLEDRFREQRIEANVSAGRPAWHGISDSWKDPEDPVLNARRPREERRR